ncbi:cell division protein FtsQ/DivIB [Porcipelethomonas sp.]|uniref:cell division protein FtsQ/DivIB n=1 Tax=Porcipelethomonas sp. TaxID=2981675 RepID=UPI003EF4F815
MRDVVKTNVKRNQNSKRTRRRRRHISLYVFLVVILVLGIGVLLSVTLFFNINHINVNGNVDYSNEDIIKVSGVGIGDNMVRLDAGKAEQNILSSMVFIEEAEINKRYPDTLEIKVTKCVAAANIQCENGFLLVSKKGKILEKVESAQNDLITISGFEPVDETLGNYIASADEQKTEIYFEIVNAVENNENSKIRSVDMNDKYDIKVNYDNRINFEMGSANDAKYKLNLADTVLKDLGDDKKGTMVMIGSNQISFRSDSDTNIKKKNNTKIPINKDDLPEDSTENTTEETQPEYEEENPDSYSEDSYEEEDSEYYEDEEYEYEDSYDEDYYSDDNFEENIEDVYYEE